MDSNVRHHAPVVLDTNVVRGAARFSANYSSDLVQAALTGRLRIALSTPLAMEYLDVLSRPDLDLPREDVRNLVGALCDIADRTRIWFRLPLLARGLPDATARRRRERDEKVLELAFAAGAETIVTHNVRDFADEHGHPAAEYGIKALTPAAFLRTRRPDLLPPNAPPP